MADEIKKNGEVEKPAEKPKTEKTLAKVTTLFWIALAILVFLLILSIALLSTRMYRYAKLADEGRIIEISADSAENFDIFSAEYKNDSGDVIIKSANGEPVIAPGASTEYTIRIKNNDNIAVDYTFNPEVKYEGAESLPLEVRLLSPNDEYLIGSSKEWGTFEDFKDLKYTTTLPKGEVDAYELEWRWLYERGEDEADTALGNAPEGSINISVGMNLHTEANTSKEANNAFFGFGTDDILWWLIFFILLLIAIVLLILSIIHNKTKDPVPAVVYVPTSAPEPVVVSAPASKKKEKGFVGKMAYVNIDTLDNIFNNGDTISLKVLKEKGLVDEKSTQVKILARNDMELHKVFHIETQGISAQAKQKVIAAGGTVKIIEG
jgi:flagellar basal body-associated protein FliL